MDPALYDELHLREVEMFKILTMGNCLFANNHVDDAVEFQSLYQALNSLECSDDLLRGLWRILSSILHLGNANVEESPTNDSPHLIEVPSIAIENLAAMLGVELNSLIRAFTTSTIRSGGVRKSVHTKMLSVLEIRNNISAVMKWLYFQVFTWLVHSINNAHSKLIDIGLSDDSLKFIGILDIFGFGK